MENETPEFNYDLPEPMPNECTEMKPGILEDTPPQLTEGQLVAAALRRAADSVECRDHVSAEFKQQLISNAVHSTRSHPAVPQHMPVTGGKRAVSEQFKNRPDPIDIGLKIKSDGNDFRVKIPAQALSVIAAVTGGGKTTTLTAVAAHLLAMGHDVDVLTLEESNTDIYARIYATLSAITKQEGATPLMTYAIPTDDVYDWFADKTDNLTAEQIRHLNQIDAVYGNKIRILDTNLEHHENYTYANKFYEYAQHRKRECEATGSRLPVMLCDYLQLMKSGEDAADYKEMKAVCKTLKSICHGLGFTMIANAQVNRDALKSKEHPFLAIQNHHMREAADIEHAAAMILLAYADHAEQMMNFKIMKMRKCKGERMGEIMAGAVAMDMRCNFIHLNNNKSITPVLIENKKVVEQIECSEGAKQPTISKEDGKQVYGKGISKSSAGSGSAEGKEATPPQPESKKELSLNDYIN